MDDTNLNSLSKPTTNQSEQQIQIEEEEGISFSQIWQMIKKHFVAIIICTIIGLAGGVIYSRAIKKATYEATSQVLVIKDISSTGSADATEVYNFGVRMASVCAGYMKSQDVQDQVCKIMAEKGYKDYQTKEGKYDYVSLSKKYDVTIPTVGSTSSTSLFVDVTATTDNEEESILLANTITSATNTLVNTEGNSMNVMLGNALVITQANIATDTSTSNVVIALIGILIGLVVGIAYAIIKELTNTKVTSKRELESLTGYKVIGMVPKYSTLEKEEEDE